MQYTSDAKVLDRYKDAMVGLNIGVGPKVFWGSSQGYAAKALHPTQITDLS